MKTSPQFAFAALTAVALAALASFSGEALAHTLLTKPPPLTTNDDAKSGPCGCEFGGDPACPANVPQTDLIAGTSYLVTWKETVNHAGSFRLAFSTKPVDQVTGADLDANVLSDETDDNNVAGATLSKSIVVPDTPCTGCTLQLRQFMEGAAEPYYYSCAKVRILPAGGVGGEGGAGGSAGGAGGESSGAGGDGQGGEMGIGGSTGPGPAAAPPRIDTGGACSAGGNPDGGSLGLFAFGALALAIATRRSRGSSYR